MIRAGLAFMMSWRRDCCVVAEKNSIVKSWISLGLIKHFPPLNLMPLVPSKSPSKVLRTAFPALFYFLRNAPLNENHRRLGRWVMRFSISELHLVSGMFCDVDGVEYGKRTESTDLFTRWAPVGSSKSEFTVARELPFRRRAIVASLQLLSIIFFFMKDEKQFLTKNRKKSNCSGCIMA